MNGLPTLKSWLFLMVNNKVNVPVPWILSEFFRGGLFIFYLAGRAATSTPTYSKPFWGVFSFWGQELMEKKTTCFCKGYLGDRWWQLLRCFLNFHPGRFGEDEPVLTIWYFSDGLVQPPTRICGKTCASLVPVTKHLPIMHHNAAVAIIPKCSIFVIFTNTWKTSCYWFPATLPLKPSHSCLKKMVQYRLSNQFSCLFNVAVLCSPPLRTSGPATGFAEAATRRTSVEVTVEFTVGFLLTISTGAGFFHQQ